jgi:NAD(P)-dependent dehydrogenase (short-subunit alcohol dehydrogenase family)
MLVRDKVVVVTGGGRGIGYSLCKRFSQEGARAVVVADIDAVANDVAHEVGGVGAIIDVGREADVVGLTTRWLGGRRRLQQKVEPA